MLVQLNESAVEFDVVQLLLTVRWVGRCARSEQLVVGKAQACGNRYMQPARLASARPNHDNIGAPFTIRWRLASNSCARWDPLLVSRTTVGRNGVEQAVDGIRHAETLDDRSKITQVLIVKSSSVTRPMRSVLGRSSVRASYRYCSM
jgi:hypothetical protein